MHDVYTSRFSMVLFEEFQVKNENVHLMYNRN